MNPFIQRILGSVIRWGLMLLVPYAVQYGILAETDALRIVEGSAIALATLAFSLWDKYRSQQKIVTATGAAGLTETKVEAMIASPTVPTPSVSTPKDEVPKAIPVTP